MASSPYAQGIDGLNVRVSRRSLIALAALVLVGGGLALLVAAWISALTVGHGELARADTRLAREVRSAAAVISADIAAADARAGSLATSRPLQRALVKHDRHAVAAVTHGRDNVLVYSGAELLAGRPRFPAIPRSVGVSAKGKMLGRVVAIVPLDHTALDRTAAEAGIRPPDKLRVRVGETVGPLGRAFDRRSDRRYRAFAVAILDAPRPVVLEAQTPRSAISHRAHRRGLWIALATLASLVTIAAVVLRARSLLRTHVRQVPRRRDVRQVLELVGDALASTHNPVKLVPVILHAAMEATGASAGTALRDGGVAAP